MRFKNRFQVYLKFTSLLNSWWIQSITERYKLFFKLFPNGFHKLANFESQNMSKSVLEVYFIFGPFWCDVCDSQKDTFEGEPPKNLDFKYQKWKIILNISNKIVRRTNNQKSKN